MGTSKGLAVTNEIMLIFFQLFFQQVSLSKANKLTSRGQCLQWLGVYCNRCSETSHMSTEVVLLLIVRFNLNSIIVD